MAIYSEWQRIKQLENRISKLESELRFIESNMRSLNDVYEAGRVMHHDVLASAMEGWANRICKLLRKHDSA